VDHDRPAVGGEMDVELEQLDAERQRLAEPAEAVLGPEPGAAAMRGEAGQTITPPPPSRAEAA
jgi:hypothetical protein